MTAYRHCPPGTRLFALIFLLPLTSGAEVVFDGTLGPGGSLSGDFEIPDSFGTQVGPNLFHSFSVFNVNAGESATFTSGFSGTTDNIIARVTGGSLSTIDGRLASSIPGADLWLINPGGVVIGDNASVALPGAFHVSSADYLVLEDGGRFDAINPGSSVLSMADPTAFGFLTEFAAPVIVSATELTIADAAELSLIGGDVAISGTTLNVPAGRINLAAAAGIGTIELSPDGLGFEGMTSFGNVSIDTATIVTSSDSAGDIYIRGGEFVMQDTLFQASTVGTNAGDSGGNVVIDAAGAQILGSQVTTTTFGSSDAGDIILRIDGDLLMQGRYGNFQGGVFANTRDVATGDGGNVSVTANNLTMTDGVAIGALSFGPGTGGSIDIDIQNAIDMRGTPELFDVSILTSASASGGSGSITIDAASITMDIGAAFRADTFDGAGGSIDVHTQSLAMTAASQITVSSGGAGTSGSIVLTTGDTSISGFQFLPSTGRFFVSGLFANNRGAGAGGDITIDALDLTLADFAVINAFVNFGAAGPGGSLTATLDRLSIINGGFMSAGTSGEGASGDVVVNAGESVFIDGRFLQFPNFTGIFANTFGFGNAGQITVNTPDLEIRDGGFISAGSFAQFAEATGSGANILVNVDELRIDAGYIQAQTWTAGDAGTITVNAADSVTLQNSSGFIFAEGNRPIGGMLASTGSFFTSPAATGNGGQITVNTDRLTILEGGGITTDTLSAGAGGGIAINARQFDASSEANAFTGVSSSTGIGTGNAGPITITVDDMALSDLAVIASATLGDGNAGSIDVSARNVLAGDGGSITTFSVGNGNAGSIDIEASDTFTATRGDLAQFENVSSTSSGPGNGGTVHIRAGTVLLEDGATVTVATSGDGAGGDIIIEAQLIDVSGSSTLSASGTGSGNAGSVMLIATDDLLIRGASIETSSEMSSGGNIGISVSDILALSEGASISAAAAGVTTDDAGGNITIDPVFVVMHESEMLATANAGNGGNIAIEADSFIVDSVSIIDASSQTGLDGRITIDSVNNVFGTVVLLESPSLDVSELLTEKCAAAAFRDRSSLTVERRPAAAWSGEGYIPSPYPAIDGAPSARVARVARPILPCRIAIHVEGDTDAD